jgi:hypothetical protein
MAMADAWRAGAIGVRRGREVRRVIGRRRIGAHVEQVEAWRGGGWGSVDVVDSLFGGCVEMPGWMLG